MVVSDGWIDRERGGGEVWFSFRVLYFLLLLSLSLEIQLILNFQNTA